MSTLKCAKDKRKQEQKIAEFWLAGEHTLPAYSAAVYGVYVLRPELM